MSDSESMSPSASPEPSSSPSPSSITVTVGSGPNKRKQTISLPLPPGSLPPRKRAKTKDEKEQRRIERIMRNRQAAHASREKKRKHVENLEKKCVDMENENLHLNEQLKQTKQKQRELLGQHWVMMEQIKTLTGIIQQTTGINVPNLDFTTSCISKDDKKLENLEILKNPLVISTSEIIKIKNKRFDEECLLSPKSLHSSYSSSESSPLLSALDIPLPLNFNYKNVNDTMKDSTDSPIITNPSINTSDLDLNIITTNNNNDNNDNEIDELPIDNDNDNEIINHHHHQVKQTHYPAVIMFTNPQRWLTMMMIILYFQINHQIIILYLWIIIPYQLNKNKKMIYFNQYQLMKMMNYHQNYLNLLMIKI